MPQRPVFGQRNLPGPKPAGRKPVVLGSGDNVLKGASVTKAASFRDRSEPTYSLLTCLACAQQRGIDFVGITWIDAQGTLGRGGQATISETRASADAVLAFKRPDSTPIGSSWFSRATISQRRRLEDAYRGIASEILALSEPDIRSHPRIVQLHAISWEIHHARTWLFRKTTRVWPILVFEKAVHGDLEKFMTDGKGKALDIAARVKLCHDVASAIATAHRKGIIHGDIKPGNVLVFEEDKGTDCKEPVAKLSDFGYSAFASNKYIRIVGTDIWRAPEIPSRMTHTLDQAKLADMFSFGVLCLWVIFLKELRERDERQAIVEASTSSFISKCLKSASDLLLRAKQVDPALHQLGMHNNVNIAKNSIRTLALELVDGMPDTTWKEKLRRLFESTLEVDTNKRAQSLQALCLADYRVREYIFYCLKEQYALTRKSSRGTQQGSYTSKSNIALQLAICKSIGFGTGQNDDEAFKYLEEAEKWRRQSGSGQTIDYALLESQIDQTKVVQHPFSPWLRALYDSGIIQPIHQGLEFRSSPSDVQEKIGEARREEIRVMEHRLGPTHPAILNMKWSLSSLLMDSPDPVVPIEYLHEILKSLEADTGRKPHDLDVVLTKAYRSLSLMRLHLPADETIEKHIREAQAELSLVGAEKHVVAYLIYAVLAEYLGMRNRFKEAHAHFQRAKEGIVAIFGRDHPNIIMIVESEITVFVRQGKIAQAIDATKAVLEDMERLIGPDEMPIAIQRNSLALLLTMTGSYKEAYEVIQGTKERFRNRLPEEHPLMISPVTHLAIQSERYEEAWRVNKKVLNLMARHNEPWPPVSPDFDIRNCAAIAEILGEVNNQERVKIYPDPEIFVLPPERMGVLAVLAISMHAHSQAEELEGNAKAAARLCREADFYLNELLKHINDGLGQGQWDNLSKTGGLRGCALRRAMDEERTPLVELVSYLGGRGIREGLIYKKVIDAARQAAYSKVTALLEEHRELCATEPSSDAQPTFGQLDQLINWVTGTWEGSYLYDDGGPRKDPKGLAMLSLKAATSRTHSSNCVRILGSGSNDVGKLEVKGEAHMSGEIKLRIFLEDNSEDEGWEYTGFANLDRQAFGGFWGFPTIPRSGALGTFFYFKCDEVS
ncbi:hypothetical protein DL768_007124 [Monosporascus sp. mg162]|nr:hypothetical protein DL768_007124 [Monosporascus sp. mg162]